MVAITTLLFASLTVLVASPADARCWWEPFAGDLENKSSGQWMTFYDYGGECNGTDTFSLGPNSKSEWQLRDTDAYTDNRYYRSHYQDVHDAWQHAKIPGYNVECSYVGRYYDGKFVRLNCV